MGCLWRTRFAPLMIAIDEEGNAVIQIDGSHAAHADGKGNFGLFVTMGVSDMINVSKNQV